jgi:bifunctional aspartokinase / homoserine dehydrogenase 1
MKFGGNSVGNTVALTQLLSIVLHEQPRWQRLILVVSALDGVTDALIEATHLAELSNRRGYRRIAATIRTRHMALIEKLPLGTTERQALQADIDRLLFDMLNICQEIADNTTAPTTNETIDAVIGVGERLSARIIAALLRQNNVRGVAIDTTDLIVTNEVHGAAIPDMNMTSARIKENLIPMLERSIVPVLTGFIAGTQSGKPTTLGRGGSDYTASILSVCAKAEEVWLWTDVDGIMTADPREIPEAQVISELSYEEMAELAYFGARVIHPRMVQPLKQHRIPLRVKNVYKPQQLGTLVHHLVNDTQPIKAVTTIQGIGLGVQHSGPLTKILNVVDETMFNAIGSHADVMISAQSSSRTFLCFVVPTIAGIEATHSIQSLLETEIASQPQLSDWEVFPVNVITAVGAELNGTPSLHSQVMRALEGVRILAVAQSPAQCSLSVVVEPKDAEVTLKQIHALTLRSVISVRG